MAGITAIVFTGPQGSGKSTFFAERFADTHVRLNLDMLGTRHREDVLLHACLAAKQPFVADNTNLTPPQRARYAALARAAGFDAVECYWFDVPVDVCVVRNAERPEHKRVPEVAIRGTMAKFAPPTRAEGFDRVWRVTPGPDGGAVVEPVDGPP
ncbi:MAG TPA: AAA family ATPase [Humisphaera sp.]